MTRPPLPERMDLIKKEEQTDFFSLFFFCPFFFSAGLFPVLGQLYKA